jgi:hypothetical protein
VKLEALKADFLKILSPNEYQVVDDIKKSNGIKFLCPKCFETNKGKIGTHTIICWWLNVDPNLDPKPGRWNPNGTGLHDLTFVGPQKPSVQITSGCMAHFMVEKGETRLV